jgi:hypothetical protein
MTSTGNTIRVVIPLTIRKRNGRPKILPPDDMTLRDGRAQDPHVLRAIARAWNWRRQLESGAASTIQDIAAAEKVSDRFVSRMMRLAYLSPEVLARKLRLDPGQALKKRAFVGNYSLCDCVTNCIKRISTFVGCLLCNPQNLLQPVGGVA